MSDGDTNVGNCRFSLRSVTRSGAWKPNLADKDALISDGDEVHLYCHSLGLGPYASLQRPPSFATPASYRKRSDEGYDIKVQVHPEYREPFCQELIRLYDTNKLIPAEQEAFEKMGMVSGREYTPLKPTVSGAKPETIRMDWKKLQKAQYKSLDLDWSWYQKQYAVEADVMVIGKPFLTVVYE